MRKLHIVLLGLALLGLGVVGGAVYVLTAPSAVAGPCYPNC
jgi:hypothetical protein